MEEREEASQMDSNHQKLFGKKLQLEMWKRMSGRKGEVEEEPGKLQRKRQRTLPRWLSTLKPTSPPHSREPPDRGLSQQTQVMPGQPTLAILPHSHFITKSCKS